MNLNGSHKLSENAFASVKKNIKKSLKNTLISFIYFLVNPYLIREIL